MPFAVIEKVLKQPTEQGPGIVELSCGHVEQVYVPVVFDGELVGLDLRCTCCTKGGQTPRIPRRP